MQHVWPVILLVSAAMAMTGCEPSSAPVTSTPPAKTAADAQDETSAAPAVQVQSEPFGETKEGVPITRYILSNDKGMTVAILSYGAIVQSIEMPDRSGKRANIVLGFPALDGYLGDDPYYGCIVGRYANRIAKGKFTLDGKEYTLAKNDGPNHIHGGLKSFADVVWAARPLPPSADGTSDGVELLYESRDGEEGYPGKVKVTVIYTLTADNQLRIDYRAVADRKTIINLTNHTYWNLHGAGSRDVRDHVLTLAADRTLAVDDGLIPTGEIKPVKGTPMDFNTPTKIGARLDQIDGGGGLKGYDHCYVLSPRTDPLQRAAARVEDPESGRVLEVFTTEPAIQFYTSNHMTGKQEEGGFKQYAAFCLECQHYPDSPNHPDFPSTVLEPGKPYTQTTIHRFSTKDAPRT
jgi:aldose 1-epimerase